MTLIAYIKQENKLLLATDSMASGASVKYFKHGEKVFGKPFKFYDEEKDDYSDYHTLIIAGAGGAGIMTSIRYAFHVPAWNNVDSFETYISASFIPCLRDFLLDLGYLKITQDGQSCGVEMFVIYNNNVIKIQDSLSPFISGETYGAIGSASLIGLGSLFTTRNQKNGEARLRRAMDAARHIDPFVGGKANILTLTEKDYILKK